VRCVVGFFLFYLHVLIILIIYIRVSRRSRAVYVIRETNIYRQSLSLIISLICLAAIKVIILYNTKSPIRLKTSLIILGNLSID